MQRTSDTPAPVITIGVTSIDESLKKVDAGGGSTIQPRTEIPNLGAYAYFKDSEGNVVGLWETLIDRHVLSRSSVQPGGSSPLRMSRSPPAASAAAAGSPSTTATWIAPSAVFTRARSVSSRAAQIRSRT